MFIHRCAYRATLFIAMLLPAACDGRLDLARYGFPLERSVVTASLRSACANLGGGQSMPDDVIQALIAEVDQFRLSGVTRNQILQAEIHSCIGGCEQACNENPELCTGSSPLTCLPYCVTCMEAIVDQVYQP